MQNARIFLVEDDRIIRRLVVDKLTKAGHLVVLEAIDLFGAMGIIKSGLLQEKGVNVAIIDGIFPRYSRKALVGTELLGPEVAEKIRNLRLPIKVIAFTSLDRKFAPYGDVYVYKGSSLEKAIKAL